ncbi:hypothetical protein MHZ92_20435 [Sporosarcina sp. ACRSL]|uniref:hypothetical protein n=1 Tax=Sporosarcina sp. ACRSL TaxID=2918215 RepID=UPI001EF6037A|nr:hypothetical protein [Sporosarcina sp. ACRSL]MCG7346476.1 hypothetical protein [Sporosarcina sp. ACRSL]
MHKKWLIIGILALFIAVAATTYYVSSRQQSGSFLSESTLSNPDLLTNTEAILYFSTTADQDMNRDGLSFAVFVDSEGKTKLFEMDGLELGTVYATEDTFFMEDRGHVYLATSDGTETFSMPTEEHTGEVTDYNEDEGLFYSVYNSGFTEDGGYMSNIRFGNEEGFETVNIPYYLQMSGLADGDLLMLTGEPENVSLQKMPLQKVVEIEEIVSLGPIGERIGMASILKEGDYYYLVMADTEKLTSDVYRIHEKTKEIETFPLFRYKDIDDYIVRIPYNLRNAATVQEGVLYYVDGIGEVHAFNSETGEAGVAFSLEGASQGQMKMSEQTYFQDGKLHLFRYHQSSGTHAIDTYDLRTGKLLNELPVEGLNDMFNYVQQKNKRVSPYDFVVR